MAGMTDADVMAAMSLLGIGYFPSRMQKEKVAV